MKKTIAIIMSIAMLSPMKNAYALSDEYILNDSIKNTYKGRVEATAIINNLKFDDIDGHWAKEAVIRDGALNLVKGYGKKYNPSATVSNAEAIAFVLRAIGMENDAIELGKTMQAQLPTGSPLRSVWSLGYLNKVNELGLITNVEYNSAIATDQTNAIFGRNDFATRERVANWIVQAFRAIDENALPRISTIQKIFSYTDYDNISPDYADAVDIITLNNIMSGDNLGKFNPQKGITRAEMAQVLKNMDKDYFSLFGYEKMTGTVGTTQDNRYRTTNEESAWRNVYVRRADGTVDILQYERDSDSVSTSNRDSVVYKNGAVTGLASLADGDEVEYITDNNTGEVLYVNVVRGVEKTEINAYLYSVDEGESTITVKDSRGNHLKYSMIEGIIDKDSNASYIRIDDKKQDLKKLPYGSILKLQLTNNVVSKISYVGEPTINNEVRGIVVENNTDFGYITINDNTGKQTTKYYYENDLIVKKQQYYDTNDTVGYIDEVFPHFKYNPRESAVSEIEVGDIVFLKLSPQDGNIIETISAATDYIAKYGKIKQLADNIDYVSMLVEYEDKQTGWYDIDKDIFVSMAGKPIPLDKIKVGDWAKLLVNQAVISPGNIMESVKEIVVDGNYHNISNIVKGSLSGINDVQKQLVLKNSYVLSKIGWGNYKNLSTYSLDGNDIEYYYNDKRISLDYAKQYFKRSDADVYVALENNFTGEKVKKVTFRVERDEVLEPDTVIHSSGTGAFNTLSHLQNISADNGTIVRRHGRLVDAQNIMNSDYAYVVLNGNNRAAIVDIVDVPTTSGISIIRGRVQSVKENNSFKVQSMSIMSGMEWIYTPVQREFAIDHSTLFIDENGIYDISNFVGFTEKSVVDKVYNIVTDGSKATYVIDSPYCTTGVKGTIYKIDGGVPYLKDAFYYDGNTGKWIPISNEDATLSVLLNTQSIIAKNNNIIIPSQLEIGDQIKVMTNNLPKTISPGTVVNGYIVIVEK